jgi:cobalt-zinc-cadmium efflux system outer membrane protein
MMFCFARLTIACVSMGLLLAVPARAAPDEAGPLTLPQAIAAAKARNPSLAASAYELRASDAHRSQVALRLNPELSLELEDFAGSGAMSGADSLQTTLSLSQAIELGGKRQHRMDVAQFGSELIAVEQQARELDVLADVTRRFINVVANQEQLTLAHATTELAERTVAAIALRVQAARSPQAELSRAQLALTRARIDARQAESALSGARYSLAALWGSTEPRFAAAQADLYRLTTLESLLAIQARLARTPDITRFASEARLRDAQSQLAQAQARPSLSFSIGVRRFEATDDTALVAGFSMPLPIANRNRGEIEEARLRREQSHAEEVAARVRIQATLSALYEQITASREQLNTLRSEAVPQAQAAFEQTQYGYERGRFSYLELASAQHELLVLQGAVIQAAADYHRLSAEIERLTSAPVVASPQ